MTNWTEFEEGYIDCLFFTNSGDEQDELTPDHDYSSFAPETIWRIKVDCAQFQYKAGELLDQAGDDTQNGHDLWFTRNGHGVGYWDRGYPEEIGGRLTDIAEGMGECWATVGDDGMIYIV